MSRSKSKPLGWLCRHLAAIYTISYTGKFWIWNCFTLKIILHQQFMKNCFLVPHFVLSRGPVHTFSCGTSNIPITVVCHGRKPIVAMSDGFNRTPSNAHLA